jgi:hypothetical protein
MGFKVKENEILYDAKGRKSHILLSYKRYESLIEQIEDLEDLKAINEVRSEPDIPFEEVKKKILKKKR